MKKVQSVLFAMALALSLSSTAFASKGILISDVKADGILISDLFYWGEITGGIVSSFGFILGS